MIEHVMRSKTAALSQTDKITKHDANDKFDSI